MNDNTIPNLRIQTYKFNLFGSEFYFILNEEYLQSIKIFFDCLNDNVSLEESKAIFVSHITNILCLRIPTPPGRLIDNFDFIIRNYIGLSDGMKKIEDLYFNVLRDKKINDIIK